MFSIQHGISSLLPTACLEGSSYAAFVSQTDDKHLSFGHPSVLLHEVLGLVGELLTISLLIFTHPN